MISAMLFESLLIVLLFAANGLFAAAELALISANRGRLKDRADQNDRRAATALRLIENPNHLLATKSSIIASYIASPSNSSSDSMYPH
jgi:CBS domain containing-hemolysin-like protein